MKKDMSEAPLSYQLISIVKQYKSLLFESMAGTDIDHYYYVLQLIDDHDEQLTQKEIGDLLQVDKSYMVSIINYLSDRGYVVREKSKQDKRSQYIRLTAKAKTVVPKIKATISALNKKAFRNLSSGQIEVFKDLLDQVQENLGNNTSFSIRVNYKKVAIEN